MWLLAEDTMRALERAEQAGLSPTAEQQRAHEERVFALGKEAGRVDASTAELVVEGILTKRPDLFAMLFGGGNTTYQSIIRALNDAEHDSSVKSLMLHIDSPGGHVDGLFDTLAALQAFSKPIKVRASNAQSAAYALAAVAGPIEAAGPTSQFGSIGIAIDRLRLPNLISITNSDSPDKRPDLDTEEGRAVVVRHLDAFHDLFTDAIATGRSISKDVVKSDFGRGATLLAGEAKRRGMIDSVRSLKPALRVVGANATQEKKMDLMTLRAQHPQLCDELEALGVAKERDRVLAHLTMGERARAMDTAVKAIRAGDGMTLTLQAEYLTAGMNARDTQARQVDSDEAGKALEGAKGGSEQLSLGDQVAALMAASRGRKLEAKHG